MIRSRSPTRKDGVSESNLRLIEIDEATGEVQNPDGCVRCRDVEVFDLLAAEKENRRLLRRVNSLQRDKEQTRQADSNRSKIIELIELWKESTGHGRSNAMSADRFDVVKSRLREGYTFEQLELAVKGIGNYPYVVNGQRVATGPASHRHDRLGIVLGGGESVEKFCNLQHQYEQEQKANAEEAETTASPDKS